MQERKSGTWKEVELTAVKQAVYTCKRLHASYSARNTYVAEEVSFSATRV